MENIIKNFREQFPKLFAPLNEYDKNGIQRKPYNEKIEEFLLQAEQEIRTDEREKLKQELLSN